MPPELRWQSGRLLTDRSLVRSQVVALTFFFGLQLPKKSPAEMEPLAVAPRTHGATAARRIPDPKVGGSNPSGFIPFFVSTSWFLFPRVQPVGECIASRAPLAERSAVNRQVLGSIPSGGVVFFWRLKRLFLNLRGALQLFKPPWPNG